MKSEKMVLAGKKAAATRKKNKQKRSDAAKRAWVTIRAKKQVKEFLENFAVKTEKGWVKLDKLV